MVNVNQDCVNCGSTSNVIWYESQEEFFCEDCIDNMEEDSREEE